MEKDIGQLLNTINTNQNKIMSDMAVMIARFDEHKFGLKIWTDTKDVEVKEIRKEIAELREYHAKEDGKKSAIMWVSGVVGGAVSVAVALITSLWSGSR
mgnify:CR=1 FL=1